MTRSEEMALVTHILEGDADAFEQIVEENEKRVYNLALKMLSNDNDALDISQEAFLKAYLGLKSFRGECRLSVWIYRLTYNLCIDFIRKKARTPAISLVFTGEDGQEGEIELPDLRHMPEDELLKRETLRAVNAAINDLGDEHREVLLLREVAGMSYIEIAETLSLSEGTVKSRLSRARESLVKKLVRNGTFSAGQRQKGESEVGRRE